MSTRSKLSRASQPTIYKAIGKRIRTERTAAGLSQSALAQIIEMHRPSLTLIELGQQKCAVHELLAIADALGFSVCDLIAELEASR